MTFAAPSFDRIGLQSEEKEMIRLKFKRSLLEYDSAQVASLEQLQERIWEDTKVGSIFPN